MLSNPETMNVNRNIAYAMLSINAAFAPYQSLSRRKLSERGEFATLLLQQMLASVVSTMWVFGAVFAARDNGKTINLRILGLSGMNNANVCSFPSGPEGQA